MKSIVNIFEGLSGLIFLVLGSAIFFADLDLEVLPEAIVALILVISLLIGISKTFLTLYGLYHRIKIRKPVKRAKKQAEKELGKNAARESIRNRMIEILIENSKVERELQHEEDAKAFK